MMALELLDTKWAGVIQPDPGSAQAGEVETEHILAPADRPCRTVVPAPRLNRELVVRVRKPITSAAVTETSVHNAVQPVTHAHGTCPVSGP